MLQKQNLHINFVQGLDTKTDPWQVPAGKFLSLTNSVFTKGGQLQKRNGYALLPSPTYAANYITTFQGNLTAIGSQVQTYSLSTQKWYSKGAITTVGVDVISLIRNNKNQVQMDSVIAPNGLICVVYTDQINGLNSFSYTIVNSVTGQAVVPATPLTGIDSTYGAPRVYLYGTWFVILYAGNSTTLQWFAINSLNSSTAIGPNSISGYGASLTNAFDAAVANGYLYIVFASSAGNAVKYVKLSNPSGGSPLSSVFFVDNANGADFVSVTFDSSKASYNYLWITYYLSSAFQGYTVALDSSNTQQIKNTFFGTFVNITSVAQNNTATLFLEVPNTYSWPAAVISPSPSSNYIVSIQMTQSGAGTTTIVARSVGLASQAFLMNGIPYVLGIYVSGMLGLNGSYFLLDSSGNVISRIAYSASDGYYTRSLPTATVSGQAVSIPYRIVTFVGSISSGVVASSTTPAPPLQQYSQTGINMVTFTYGVVPYGVEIAQNLNLTGGFLTAFDGLSVTENNFFVTPDPIQAAWNTNNNAPVYTFTIKTTSPGFPLSTPLAVGDVYADSASPPNYFTILTSVAAGSTTFTALYGGGGTAFTGTKLNRVNGFGQQTIFILGSSTAALPTNSPLNTMAAQPLSGTTATVNEYAYIVVYEWMDNQGNIHRSTPSQPVFVTTSGNTTPGHGNGSVELYIPTLRLTHKTANPVKIGIYRWSIGQTTYHLTGLITLTPNNTPVINNPAVDSIVVVDTLADSYIQANPTLYTTGGVLPDFSPPGFSNTFLFDDRLWGIDGEDKNTLYYSKEIIEGTPVEMSGLQTYYVAPSLGAQGPSGNLLCGFPMDDKAILFKRASISYFTGSGPDATGNNSQYTPPILITTTIGCSNQKSIVFMPNGLMFEFASQSGNQIWLLGRDLSTVYIGAEVEGLMSNATVLSAVNIPGANQVRFTLSTGITLVYDYFYKQWGTFVFPLGTTSSGIPAISSTIYNGLHTYVNAVNSLYQENPGSYLDGGQPVLMSFTTSWLSLAGIQGYQRAYFFQLLANYISPHKLVCQIAYDYNPAPQQSTIISPTNYSPTYGGTGPGGQVTVWGQDIYGGPSSVENWRVFLSKQKCNSFQISIQETYDSSIGAPAGAGLTLSGINLVVGQKKGYRPIAAANSAGG
jgi:hypothetical protein